MTELPFLNEIVEACTGIFQAGWGENHAGNISFLLTQEEVDQYLTNSPSQREPSIAPLATPIKDLDGKYFLVTSAGGRFKNIEKNPNTYLGIIQIINNGAEYKIIWGFEGNKRPTSELPTHLLSHAERLKVDREHRIILHCHPTYTIGMTFIHELKEDSFTKTMWSLNSECVLVFPEGIGLLPWMVCGNGEIGSETANKMKEYRIVIWPHHGILAAGQSVDQALGLIETVEKNAQVYTITADKQKQCMTDEQIVELAEAFGLSPRGGILGEVQPTGINVT